MLRLLDLRAQPVLMRRLAEHGLEEPNEMEFRKSSFAGHLAHRPRTMIPGAQKVACVAEAL